MRKITDLNGLEWKIQITVGTIKRVNSELNLDIYNIANEGFLETIIEDYVRFIDMMFVICEDEAKERGISDIEFGKAFDGEHIDIAVDEFLTELVSFFPKSRRMSVEKALAKTQELAKVTGEKLVKKINEIDINEKADLVMGSMKLKL